MLRRVVPAPDRAERCEGWLEVVLTQLLGCRHLLYTRAGLLFGFRIGWHVYTSAGVYVGSFHEPIEDGPGAGLFSAGGAYLGELDPEDAERLAVDSSRLRLRRQPAPALPAVPVAAVKLYSVRPPLLPRDGWEDFPGPETFAADGAVASVYSTSVVSERERPGTPAA